MPITKSLIVRGGRCLADAGCSTDQIKAMTGHKSPSEISWYIRAADQTRLARQEVCLSLEESWGLGHSEQMFSRAKASDLRRGDRWFG